MDRVRVYQGLPHGVQALLRRILTATRIRSDASVEVGRSLFEDSNVAAPSAALRLGTLAALTGFGTWVCAQLGYGVSIPPSGVVVIWPGAGFVLAALILAGRRAWPAMIIGAFVGGLIADVQHGVPTSVAVWGAGANCAESVVAAWLVTRFAGPRVALRTLREVAVLIIGAALVSNAFTALLGAFVLRPRGLGGFEQAWLVWWTGDGMGMLIIAPVILTWTAALRARRRLPRRAAIEAVAALGAVAVVGYALLARGRADSTSFSRDPFLVFPLVLWAATRFGTWGASTAILILSAIVVWLTAHGSGPFVVAGAPPASQAHAVYAYLALASVSALIPASILRERQHAEAQIRRSEERFREMAEHVQEAFFVLDLVKRETLYVSPIWAQIWGRPLAEGYDPKVWVESIHPDDRAAMAASQAAVMRGEASSNVFRVIRPGGEIRWVRGRAYPVRDKSGTVHRLVGVSEDITLARQTELALGRSRTLLSQAGQLARIGGWQVEVETQRLSWSDEIYRIVEVDPTGQPSLAEAAEFFTPEARTAMTAALRAAMESGTPFDLELPGVTARGREIWVRTAGVPERQQGRVVRVLGVLQDITERKKADDLRRLQSAALDATANAMVITDRAGTIEWTNPAFTRLTGYTAEEVIGKNLGELVKSGKQPATFYRELWTTILSGRTWEGEMVNRRKDGSLHSERQAITPIVDASGTITHFVAVKMDITARLKLEGDLRQSAKMETMGQLASSIAHDFNNLLTVINGVGELALAGIGEDDPVRADVQEMVRAGERSAQLTRQLLAFSRQQLLQPKVIQLNVVVTGSEPLLRRLLGEDIELVVALGPDLGNVNADLGQLEQVIVNLAVNARDAMPRGGRLTVETRNVVVDATAPAPLSAPMPPGRYVQLAISDTGIGMDDATRARIFDPFFTTKAPGKGTGLGLSTVYGIVSQSDGFVSVESTVGQGTTFTIHLPRVTAGGDPLPDPKRAAKPTTGSETILVVDDTPEVCTLLKRLLESSGYTVLTAATGSEALQVLHHGAERVHLALTDVVMPDMGGRELADRLAVEHREIRVLYMSGHTDDDVIRHGVSHATMPFLPKPFTRSALLEKVRQVLDA